MRALVPGAWSLRHNLTMYDGAYVALAEHLGAPLLNPRGPLAQAVAQHTEVNVIGM